MEAVAACLIVTKRCRVKREPPPGKAQQGFGPRMLSEAITVAVSGNPFGPVHKVGALLHTFGN